MANTMKYTQFSKRLTMFIAIFWCVYRIAALIAAAVRPDIAGSVEKIQDGADDVMMTTVLAYNGNSLGEKGFAKYFETKANRTANSDDQSEG